MPEKKKHSIQSEAYEYIKKKIMMCEYLPNQLLSESILQEELGCSRTPVREAIRRLEQEGLATVLPKRGIVVSGFSIGDIRSIFEVRMLIEPYAVQTYGEALDQKELRRFLELFQRWENPNNRWEFYQLDDEFHEFLISGLANEYLHDLYGRIQTQNVRLRVMSGQMIASWTAPCGSMRILPGCAWKKIGSLPQRRSGGIWSALGLLILRRLYKIMGMLICFS